MKNSLNLFSQAAQKLGISLSPKTIPQFQTFFQELLIWNKKFNLTRITKEKEVFIDHFIDSLIPERFVPPKSTLIDIGSGGGFPGIPLKIVRPDIIVTLVDSSYKKVAFQRHIIRTLKLKNITGIHERIENISSLNKVYSVCIGRAFASLTKYLLIALSLKAPKGIIIAMKGPNYYKELGKIEKQLPQWGISIKNLEKFVLPYTKKRRTVIVFE